jgi:hypothetical protein
VLAIIKNQACNHLLDKAFFHWLVSSSSVSITAGVRVSVVSVGAGAWLVFLAPFFDFVGYPGSLVTTSGCVPCVGPPGGMAASVAPGDSSAEGAFVRHYLLSVKIG